MRTTYRGIPHHRKEGGLVNNVIQSDLDNPAFFNPEPLISDSVS